jgi:hypothetical protein
MRSALPRLAAWLLIIEHAVRMAFLFIAWFGMTVLPIDAAEMERQGIAWWTVSYGGITGAAESIVLIALGVLVLRGNSRARQILLWLLPVLIVHSVAWSLYIDLPLQGALFSDGLDILAWLALLAARRIEATAPARR